jgi:hypothetical protein
MWLEKQNSSGFRWIKTGVSLPKSGLEGCSVQLSEKKDKVSSIKYQISNIKNQESSIKIVSGEF